MEDDRKAAMTDLFMSAPAPELFKLALSILGTLNASPDVRAELSECDQGLLLAAITALEGASPEPDSLFESLGPVKVSAAADDGPPTSGASDVCPELPEAEAIFAETLDDIESGARLLFTALLVQKGRFIAQADESKRGMLLYSATGCIYAAAADRNAWLEAVIKSAGGKVPQA